MNIHLANYQPDRLGGGWTFANYFVKYFGQSDYESCDIYFIANPGQASRDEVQKAKSDGKKIVLRCDNALRNSRNRNSGMTRFYDIANLADALVYQSHWAKRFLEPFLERTGSVILNGVDTDVYNPDNRIDTGESFLYARSSRDEGKGWINAWYWFVEHHNYNPESRLEIVGQFSSENLEYNFDFFNGEQFLFTGQQPSLVDSMKRNKYLLYSFWNDACSNTLLEARACGCEIINVHGALDTGGAPEIMALKDLSIERCLLEYEAMLSSL